MKLITINNCTIEHRAETLFKPFSWTLHGGDCWLVSGANGSGKTLFASALAGETDIVPQSGGSLKNDYHNSTALVSFEKAAALIEEERANDNSDFVEGGVDPGRTVRTFLSDVLSPDRNAETDPMVIRSGITSILDRGLKYLSTGEIRRCLLCHALLSGVDLLIIDEPFEGLDTAARRVLSTILEERALRARDTQTALILIMDRPENVPEGINKVLVLENLSISFSGDRSQYEQSSPTKSTKENCLQDLRPGLDTAQLQATEALTANIRTKAPVLVEMKNVTVEWSDRKVLESLSWKLVQGEHWLIRGPNGSGKTTFLELITGDNPQVFRNEVYLFGNKRGSGETIWELKEKMGIVSYHLHVEYRQLGSTSIKDVVLSGIHDSIGLYQHCGEEEKKLAERWLALAGFEDRSDMLFRELSYGEQRAVLIARATVKSPPLLILDEPCHGLDSVHRNRILSLLQAIAESGGTTLLHVTHDPSEVLPCEKHVLELLPGETPMYRIIKR